MANFGISRLQEAHDSRLAYRAWATARRCRAPNNPLLNLRALSGTCTHTPNTKAVCTQSLADFVQHRFCHISTLHIMPWAVTVTPPLLPLYPPFLPVPHTPPPPLFISVTLVCARVHVRMCVCACVCVLRGCVCFHTRVYLELDSDMHVDVHVCINGDSRYSRYPRPFPCSSTSPSPSSTFRLPFLVCV